MDYIPPYHTHTPFKDFKAGGHLWRESAEITPEYGRKVCACVREFACGYEYGCSLWQRALLRAILVSSPLVSPTMVSSYIIIGTATLEYHNAHANGP